MKQEIKSLVSDLSSWLKSGKASSLDWGNGSGEGNSVCEKGTF